MAFLGTDLIILEGSRKTLKLKKNKEGTLAFLSDSLSCVFSPALVSQ